MSTNDPLLAFLERSLQRFTPPGAGIERVTRERSRFATAFPVDVITAHLSNGEQIRAFFKDLGSSAIAKDDMGARRERELTVYRDLIEGSGLGTAELYGWEWEPGQGRFWLLLELVPGMPVRYCDVEYWVISAGWLGRMQAHFDGDARLAALGNALPLHDRQFFQAKAERALKATATTSTGLSRRLSRVIDQYETAIDVMVAQPTTLVHGSYRPRNILIDETSIPTRICPIDWEMASLGSPLYDFAFFVDGFEPPYLEQMWRLFQASAPASSLSSPEEMAFVVDHFRLHKVMHWLGYSIDWNYDEETVEKLVGMAEDFDRELMGNP